MHLSLNENLVFKLVALAVVTYLVVTGHEEWALGIAGAYAVMTGTHKKR